METHIDLCHALNEPFLILLPAVCLVTGLWPPHRWWSQSLWPALLNCLRPSWLQKETWEAADVGFSLALLSVAEPFSTLWLSPYLYTEMAVTVRQRGFQMASTLDGGTPGTDYPVSSLTTLFPWKRPLWPDLLLSSWYPRENTSQQGFI